MLFRHGAAMTAAMPRLRPVDRQAVRHPPLPRGCALRRRERTLAARFVSLRRSWALAASSQPMAAARAGGWWHLPVRLIKQAPWRATCVTAQSCLRQWQALTRKIRRRSICQCLHGRLALTAILRASALAFPRSIAWMVSTKISPRCGIMA